MSTIGDRLKRAMDSGGHSQESLAKSIGISQQAIQQILSGETRRSKYLPEIAGVVGVKLSWLISGEGPMREELEPNTEPAPGPQGTLVPVISWVHAGTPTEVFDPYEPGHAEEWIAPTFKPGPHVYGLRVVGVSMTPRFQPGQILIVDPDRPWHSGSFVILKNGDGEAVFRQIVKETGEWMMVALNPDYKPKPLGDYRVIGVVRQAIDLVS